MRTTNRGIVAMIGSFAFVSVIALTPAFAGQEAPAPAAQAEAQKSETAKGELRSIDPAKKTAFEDLCRTEGLAPDLVPGDAKACAHPEPFLKSRGPATLAS